MDTNDLLRRNGITPGSTKNFGDIAKVVGELARDDAYTEDMILAVARQMLEDETPMDSEWYREKLETLLERAYTFIVDHEECDCNRCDWRRAYNDTLAKL